MSVSPLPARPTPAVASDADAVLDALVDMLRSTLGRFEATAGRVTELVLQRKNSADRELIVGLQDFDRLQQEFAALIETLSRYAAGPVEHASTAGHGEQLRAAIAAITVGELRDRLMQSLVAPLAPGVREPDSAETIF